MERKADRIVWALTVAAALVATVVVGATAGNGDFEQGARGWSVLQRDSTRRDAPRVADGVNLPDPPGSAAGRSHAAVLGDDPDTFFPAANPSVLYRRFRLDDEPFDHGVLAFDARLWSQGDDVAAVVVTSKLGVRAWRIRPQRPGGAPERRVAGFLREGPVVVEFVLFSPAVPEAGTGAGDSAANAAELQSILIVDNVAVWSERGPKPTTGLEELRASDVPRPGVRGAVGVSMPAGAAPIDCDANGTPDVVDIARAPSLDADGDKHLDRCDGQRGVNWTLMLMGLLVLIPTLMRLAARQKRAAAPTRRGRRTR